MDSIFQGCVYRLRDDENGNYEAKKAAVETLNHIAGEYDTLTFNGVRQAVPFLIKNFHEDENDLKDLIFELFLNVSELISPKSMLTLIMNTAMQIIRSKVDRNIRNANFEECLFLISRIINEFGNSNLPVLEIHDFLTQAQNF